MEWIIQMQYITNQRNFMKMENFNNQEFHIVRNRLDWKVSYDKPRNEPLKATEKNLIKD